VTDSNGSQIKQTTKTTDANGFVAVSFTPTGTGQFYGIEAELPSGLIETESFDVVPRLGKSPFLYGATANPGSTNAYPGVVDTGSGPLANTGVDLEFSDASGNTITTKSTTTDDRGFFAVEYDLPSSYNDNFVQVAATTASGDAIVLVSDVVFVSSSSSGGGGGGPTLTASSDSPRAPGETVTVDVQAEDDGTPITNQDVEVLLQYGFGGPPAYWTTVTTDSTGSASTSFALPNDAPDANVLDCKAAMDYEGSTYEGGSETNIRKYDIGVEYTAPAPGISQTYTVEVTDAVSGDGVQGVPAQVDLSYDEGLTGSFATAGFDTESDGTDSASVSTPSDIGFRSYFNYVHRYRTQNSVTITRNDLPGTLSTNDTLVPGEDAQFTFSTPSNVTLDGVAYGTTLGADGKSYGTRFGGSGTSRTFILRVPPELSGGEEFSLGTWASDGSGTRYSDVARFTADTASISLGATGESSVPVGGEATVSVSADQVTSITIQDLWTDWTLDASNPDGGTVTDDISSAGEVTIDYSSRTGSVSPSITVGLPSRYIGGEYLLVITATNDTGASAETTAVVTIA
jgi:hypothetical protein